jgi:RNA polymerase sigma-B factor
MLVMDPVIGLRQPRRSAAQRRRELRVARARRSGDPSERAALIEEFMPLARALARRFPTSEDSREDLVQVACLGLVKAFDRCDPERGTIFSSFAMPTIMGESRRHLRDRTWRLHVPRDVQELSVALAPAVEALSGELGRSPSDDGLASRLRVSPDALREARQAADTQLGHSLDEPAHAGAHGSLAETLGREDRGLDRTERVMVLESWLAALPEREREILGLRVGEDRIQREIGERLGISQVQVSRLVRTSLDHLHGMAAEDEERSLLAA